MMFQNLEAENLGLITVEVVLQQIGPRLTQRAIDKGVVPGDYSIVLHLGLIYIH